MPTREDVRSRLRGLAEGVAETLEDDRLEFLPWSSDLPALLPVVVRHVVAFANSKGGTIAVGVEENTKGRKAIRGVGKYDADALRNGIYRSTADPVLVQLEDHAEPEGSLLLIHVPQGVPLHSTIDGVVLQRAGSESQPLVGAALRRALTMGSDRSAEALSGTGEDDLDPRQIEAVQDRMKEDPQLLADFKRLAGLSRRRFTRELGLMTDEGVTLAGMLLVGRLSAIERHVPMHEIIFLRYTSSTEYDQRVEMRGPILAVMEQMEQTIAAHNRRVTIREPGFRHLEVPDISWEVARESVLNAICHRDYWLRQGITVGLHEDYLEIISPGGFMPGITPENILRHGPDHRSEFLVRCLHKVGLVNRIGIGIDRIYRELLRLGKGLPRYSATEGQVRLVIPLKTDEKFALFVNQENLRRNKELDLDDLLVLRALTERANLDRWSAGEILQRPESEAANKLMELREARYLAVRGRGAGTRYALSKELAERLGLANVPRDDLRVGQRLVSEIHKRGRMTNAEIREFFNIDKTAAYRLASGLVEQGDLKLVKAGRASYFTTTSNRKRKA